MSESVKRKQTLWTTIRDLHGLLRITAKSGRPDVSFAGEFECLSGLASLLGLRSGFVVDIGASDGVSQSSTLGFLRQPGWSGLAIEHNGRKFARLAFVHSRRPDVQLARALVTPANVASLLRGFDVPQEFSILNLDIDGYDLHVMRALVEAGFRPAIVSMEINELIAPPVHFTVDYTPGHSWNGDRFFGCSTAAAAEMLAGFDYVLHSVQYNNAVFVRRDAVAGRFAAKNPLEAWREGYLLRSDRRALFPWNDEHERLLSAPPEAIVAELDRMFVRYRGRYTLRTKG